MKKGSTLPEETKLKISITRKQQHIIPRTAFKKGEKSWNTGVIKSYSYGAIHKRIYKKWGKPTQCEFCKVDNLTGQRINWANLPHTYDENKREDWAALCCKCHRKYDYKYNIVTK